MRHAWNWLLDRSEAYPADAFMPALRPPRSVDVSRKLLAVRMVAVEERNDELRFPFRLLVSDGTEVHESVLHEDAEAADQFAQMLLTKRTRGHLLAFWHGGREAFHLILRELAPGLTERGFSIQPLANGSDIKALIFRKGRQSWWLTDVQTMTGLTDRSEAEFLAAYAPRRRAGEHQLTQLLRALKGFERVMLDNFGAALRVTLGASAMRAASHHVPARGWVWRPPPLAVTMARDGGGFRGGYAAAERFVGQAWRADLNKAYTSVLADELPGRLMLGAAESGLFERPGLYLCRVSGRGIVPAYLATWTGGPQGFALDYWKGGDTVAVLPSSEFAGLRQLGYTVEPGYGFVTATSWQLGGFVRAVERAVQRYERGSPEHQVAKLIGNSVYGKLAENPHRLDVQYAAERPGDEWRPYVTDRGDEVAGVWEAESVAYRPHQHVDVAAAVTGAVRGKLYGGIAAVRAAGGRVVHADTDGLLTTIDPSPYLDTDETRLGAWRVSEGAELTAVWGRKGSSFGADVRAAGIQSLTQEQALRLAQGEELAMPVEMVSAPWRGADRITRLTRRARATA
jgi:hypothetical protein